MAASPVARPPLVITGATGFVGRRLVERLRLRASDRAVTLLTRDPWSLAARVPLPPGWRVARADLASGSIAPGDIPPGTVVVHLAAATGRLSPATMWAVNVDGTRRLLDAARAASASHVIFVSSIAAGFSDRRWYPYAEAKREGEALVRASGMPYTIVRPTMVFGEGSPVQEGLERLALGAAPLVPGRGAVQVQPIHVDDLAELLTAVALAPEPCAEPVEVGGATRTTMRALLAAVRHARGAPPRRVVGVPLAAPRRLLALAESVLGPLLPVTAGQLASFVNDGVAEPHPLVQQRLPAPRTLEAMLAPGGGAGHRPAAPVPRAALGMAGDPEPADALAREFVRFARYLGTASPPATGVEAYTRAAPGAGMPTDRLDRWLLVLARGPAPACALADAYARVARPYGQLRRRLVLALAVLESSADTHAAYDTAVASPPLVAWLALGVAGTGWLLRTVAALALLGPLHLAARLAGGREVRRG
jgi:nucleoside-diphosphate-sugar epimerase